MYINALQTQWHASPRAHARTAALSPLPALVTHADARIGDGGTVMARLSDQVLHSTTANHVKHTCRRITRLLTLLAAFNAASELVFMQCRVVLRTHRDC
jgi:hypothetical protein